MYNKIFPWSDNWWIEEKKAWFCAGSISALFCVDIDSSQCKLEEWIPECDVLNKRMYSYCLRHNENIFCLPSKGKCIWIYNTKTKNWEEIEINDEGQIVIYLHFYKPEDDKIWLLGCDSKRIYELNLQKRLIEKEYSLPQYKNRYLGQYVLVENKLYCVNDNKIHCIDTISDDIVTYDLPDVNTELHTICYDGNNFWLSGYCKEIYVWNPEQGILRTIREFPETFGLCCFRTDDSFLVDHTSLISSTGPFFCQSISLGKYIWYIPEKSCEILYIDKISYKIYVFEITEEQETKESLKRPYGMLFKYLFEYIRDNRYIGLYSVKNQTILEIDTVRLRVEKSKYELSDNAIRTITQKYYNEKGIFFEKKGKCGKVEQLFFGAMLFNSQNENEQVMSQNTGKLIYNSLKL